MTTGTPEVRAHWRSLSMQFRSFTMSVVTNILTAVPSKKEKLPLSVTHPELAKEADGWDPSEFTSGSGKKLLWKCSFGHNWESPIANRTKGSGCGVCANHIIVPGINDLATLYPDLAAQADGWDPKTIGAGSHKRLRWKCREGHTWETNPKHRVNGTGCPVCDGQKIVMGINDLLTTNPEIAAQAFGWDPSITLARHHQKYSWKCSAGHVWDATITARKTGRGCHVCTGKKISIPHNSLPVEYPDIAAEAHGWDPETVMAKSGLKKDWKCIRGHIWTSTVYSRTSGAGCPICSNQKVLAGFNDLASTHPDLAKQAEGWDPTTKIAGSNKKLRWKCQEGHIWDAVLASRALNGNGCPYCSGKKVLPGFNDLQTLYPEIAKEAIGWDPTTVSSGNSNKFDWLCSLGHKYTARVDHRTTGVSNCHYCSGHRVLVGFNDLLTLNPDLAAEASGWDPSEVSIGSAIKKKWICKEGHTWIAAVVDRKLTGCPSCAKTGFDPNQDGYLYFISHPDWKMFQIGITNDPDMRLGRHKKLGWESLELRGPMDGHLTQQWETAILRMLKAKGADLSNEKIAGKFDGYSEAWSKSTFEVDSIKELMRLTEEYEGN